MPSPVHLPPPLLSHASYGGSNTIELVLCSVLELLHWNHPGVGFVGSTVPLEPSVWAAKYSFSRGRFRTINDTCVPLPAPLVRPWDAPLFLRDASSQVCNAFFHVCGHLPWRPRVSSWQRCLGLPSGAK